MWSKLLVFIVSLSLATLACSLAPPGYASEQRPTEPTTTAVVALQNVQAQPAVFATPTTAPAIDINSSDAASDLGIIDASDAASAPEQQAEGHAAAVDSLKTSQEMEAAIYVPSCVPVLNWPLYVVVSGDTLHKIATQHGTSWQSLAQANCLATPNLIYVGQALHVPPAPSSPPDSDLPVISDPDVSSPPGCNVFVKDPSQLVPIYDGPGTAYRKVAYLDNYAHWLETTPDGYRIAFPFGGSGWVSKQATYRAGECGFELPTFGNPGNPPLNACNAVPLAAADHVAWVHTSPSGQGDVLGRLTGFAPVVQYVNGSYEIALRQWNVVGWVRETDVGLVGTCGNYHPPTPTRLPTATHTPAPTPTATASPPFSDLPRVNPPGRPATDACVVSVNPGTRTLIYPGPISTGPIAVLETYAPTSQLPKAGT